MANGMYDGHIVRELIPMWILKFKKEELFIQYIMGYKKRLIRENILYKDELFIKEIKGMVKRQ